MYEILQNQTFYVPVGGDCHDSWILQVEECQHILQYGCCRRCR